MKSLKKRLLSKLTRKPIEDFVVAHKTDRRILEIGSASSYYESYFPNRVGFDIRPGPTVDVVGDVHDMPFEGNEFDAILCIEVLEHLYNPQKALDEMLRVLRPGGELILTTRFIQVIHDAPGDYFRFTKYGLLHLLREWDVVEIKGDMKSAQTFGSLLQRIAFQTDLHGGNFTKFFLFVLARCTGPLGWLIKREYGRKNELGVYLEETIMPAGYHVFARKK